VQPSTSTPTPNDDDRRGILERFNQRPTRVLSNCSVLAEGWDCPACEVMILARPTRSLIRYIQMAGRVLRPVYAGGRPDKSRRAASAR
jgi:superfamily II DNA or RNA helicase